jgi:hypothetical protein
MECTITENYFTTEEEALALVAAMGWYGFALDLEITADEELHWHDVEQVAFVIEGTARTRLYDGRLLEATPGSRVDFPAGLVHQDVVGEKFRIVLAFPIDPSELSQPFNKPEATAPKSN